MKLKKLYSAMLFLFLLFGSATPVSAQEEEFPIIRGVLFHSPTCSHCRYVITEVLPPLIQQYDEQLLIHSVDVSTPEGQILYQMVIELYDIPDARMRVPTLIIGDYVMVGSEEIPELLPLIIDEGLAHNGFLWPDLPGIPPPGLEQSSEPMEETENDAAATAAIDPSDRENGAPDFAATEVAKLKALAESADVNETKLNSVDFVLGMGVFILLFSVLGYAAVRMRNAWEMLKCAIKMKYQLRQKLRWWGVPVLTLIGIGISGYMVYVEAQNTEAVCGPVGNCNLVQQSQYAHIGPVPVAALGILGYALIALFWFMQQGEEPRTINAATLGLLILPIGAVFFSIYLTYIELFVLHAICIWCLSSAVVSAGMMLLVTNEIAAEAKVLEGQKCAEEGLA